MDSSLIGQSTAKFMESLENRYEGNDLAKVTEVMVIAQVVIDLEDELGPEDDNEETDTYSRFHYYSSDKHWSHQRGLAQAVINSLDDHEME